MKRIFIALFIMVVTTATAFSAPVEKITGRIDTPELALDGNPATGAVLSRVPGVEPFEFIVYLDGKQLLRGVKVYLSPTPEKSLLETSEDIVTWGKQSIIVTTSEVEGGGLVNLELKQPADAMYVKVQLWMPEGVEEIKLHEVSASFTDRAIAKASDVKHEVLDDNTVRVTYTTDEPVFSQVRYGTGGPTLDMVVAVREKKKSHELLLENLSPGTTYAYQVVLGGDGETGNVRTFTTSGSPPPMVLNIHIPPPAPDNVSIVMTANKPVKWIIHYGLYDDFLTAEHTPGTPGVIIDSDDSFQQNIEFKLENLQQGKRYAFDVVIEDEEGNRSSTDLYGFDTARLNYALGKPVTGTFTGKLNDKFVTKTDAPLVRVTDGDENYHTGFAVSQKTKYEDQWLEIDLGETREIADLVIIWSRLAAPEEYNVYLSEEPGAEGAQKAALALSVKEGKYPENVIHFNRQSPNGDTIFEVSAPVNTSARYIRLEIPAGARIISILGWKYAVIAEIKALATR